MTSGCLRILSKTFSVIWNGLNRVTSGGGRGDTEWRDLKSKQIQNVHSKIVFLKNVVKQQLTENVDEMEQQMTLEHFLEKGQQI